MFIACALHATRYWYALCADCPKGMAIWWATSIPGTAMWSFFMTNEPREQFMPDNDQTDRKRFIAQATEGGGQVEAGGGADTISRMMVWHTAGHALQME